MDLFKPIIDFADQSKRVLNVTHKPRDLEFRQMTITTGLGLAIMGVIGFLISMATYYLRLI